MSNPILEIEGVSKHYFKHTALDNVSLTVPKGSIFGLLGPNGAGKTSLIRMITQITAPDEGEIRFKGERLKTKHIAEIGYLPEERGLYKSMKVGEHLIYLGRLKDIPTAKLKESLKFWLERLEMQGWWDKKISDLSKGMQQKVQFIATVIHEPDFIILDEPFSGFDPINAEAIRKEILRLRDQGVTILFSTHRMESVEEICDEIALINKAHIVLKGKTKEVQNSFRKGQWIVEGLGQATVPEGLDLLYHQQNEQDFMLLVQAQENQNVQTLLAQLDGLDIRSIREKIPSVHEIFIQTVQGD